MKIDAAWGVFRYMARRLVLILVLLLPAPAMSAIADQLMSDLQRDFGLTNAQAAGVVGNLAHESGNFRTMQEISPTVAGSRGGYGYAQWTGSRRVEFENYAASNGLDINSYEANYGFFKHELYTSESSALDGVRGAMTPEEAAIAFEQAYLRAGIKHYDSRINYANQFADGNFEGSGTYMGGSGSGGGTDTPSVTPPEVLLMFWLADSGRGGLPPGTF